MFRVFEVVIEPGCWSQFHRHNRDTIYLRTTSGRSKSEQPGQQLTPASLGRSTGLFTGAYLLARRRFRRGWLDIPAGTVMVQPNGTMPLIHRVAAHRSNQRALRLVGVELQDDYRLPAPLPETAELRAEIRDSRFAAYRLRIPQGAHAALSLPCGGVFIVVAGTARLSNEQETAKDQNRAGPTGWHRESGPLHADGDGAVDGVVVPT